MIVDVQVSVCCHGYWKTHPMTSTLMLGQAYHARGNHRTHSAFTGDGSGLDTTLVPSAFPENV